MPLQRLVVLVVLGDRGQGTVPRYQGCALQQVIRVGSIEEGQPVQVATASRARAGRRLTKKGGVLGVGEMGGKGIGGSGGQGRGGERGRGLQGAADGEWPQWALQGLVGPGTVGRLDSDHLWGGAPSGAAPFVWPRLVRPGRYGKFVWVM